MKRLLALCLLLALLLCACSAAGQSTQATQQPTEETAAAPTETAAAPKTFGLSYLPEHGFNPYICTATVNRAAFSLLYESLFVVSSHFRAEPLLCESFTVSEDGKTYRYTLVSGVSFSDGTPLTAQDAAASLRAAQQSALYSGRLAHMLSDARCAHRLCGDGTEQHAARHGTVLSRRRGAPAQQPLVADTGPGRDGRDHRAAGGQNAERHP